MSFLAVAIILFVVVVFGANCITSTFLSPTTPYPEKKKNSEPSDEYTTLKREYDLLRAYCIELRTAIERVQYSTEDIVEYTEKLREIESIINNTRKYYSPEQDMANQTRRLRLSNTGMEPGLRINSENKMLDELDMRRYLMEQVD